MIVICRSNEAFEDKLTAGRGYKVRELRNNSVLVLDDTGASRWFGVCKFQFLTS